MTTTDLTPEANSGGLRDRKKQQTRTAIHDAARRLIEEHGLAGVTVGEICASADVSPRTFFNYFPSKAAAALALPETPVGDEARARFLASDGRLIDDVCVLVAETAATAHDQRNRKQLVSRRPEVTPALMHWLFALREEITGLVADRVDERTARIAVALAIASLLEVQHGHDGDPLGVPELTDRLRAAVAEMCAVGLSAA